VEFAVNTIAGIPIYQQLSEQICAAIARGRLRPGDRLPSVRELSQSLVINPNTAARAYTELERSGVLYTRPGLGVFVNPIRPLVSKAERRGRIEKPLDDLLVSAVHAGCPAEEVTELVEERVAQFKWPANAERASLAE
jgi:GntR family transcriptional regulator